MEKETTDDRPGNESQVALSLVQPLGQAAESSAGQGGGRAEKVSTEIAPWGNQGGQCMWDGAQQLDGTRTCSRAQVSGSQRQETNACVAVLRRA